MNFYNDIDSNACAWMRQLVADRLIPTGDVSCKSIVDITPDEIKTYTQQHFFCGIAGWPKAIDLAGWSRTRPIWSASLPCQSFSLAGKGGGFDDHRGKLWEPFLELVKQCRPEFIVGEQVSSAIGKGWVDRVRADLEAEGYSFGFIVLGAHSVNAPHKRQRIYFVAHTAGDRRSGSTEGWQAEEGRQSESGNAGEMEEGSEGCGGVGNSRSVRCDNGERRVGSEQEGSRCESRSITDRPGQPSVVADSQQPGLEGHAGDGDDGGEPRRKRSQADGSTTEGGSVGDTNIKRVRGRVSRKNGIQKGEAESEGDKRERIREHQRDADHLGAWSDFRIIQFKDGSQRRIERSFEPMASGLPKGVVRSSYQGMEINADSSAEGRKMRLHGYGNSVVLPLAVEFVRAVMEEFLISPAENQTQ